MGGIQVGKCKVEVILPIWVLPSDWVELDDGGWIPRCDEDHIFDVMLAIIALNHIFITKICQLVCSALDLVNVEGTAPLLDTAE